MKKRTVSIILSLVMAFAVIPVDAAVFAEEKEQEFGKGVKELAVSF